MTLPRAFIVAHKTQDGEPIYTLWVAEKRLDGGRRVACYHSLPKLLEIIHEKWGEISCIGGWTELRHWLDAHYPKVQ